ncbi:MAG TPA: ABC transporter ATP-binding protein [Thermoanaerobaculia bacterium]
MIQVSHVSKRYGRFGRPTLALDDVSLEVQTGETLGLIGPNGAGKTTLLSCLLGFLRPDSGSIRIAGKPPDDLSVRAGTGYMPERLGFDRELTGRAFLAHHWRLAGGDPRATETETRAAAERVGLEPSVLSRKLRTYSRGMLQRIGVAQATLRDPQWLFLDEPASGTDPMGVAVVRERILEAKSRGATIVLNSHQLPEVERVCDRVVFIDRGRLLREETLRGDAATARRTLLRTLAGRADEAVPVLGQAGIAARVESPGTLVVSVARDEEIARAVACLVQAGIPVFEARVSADLEQLFRKGA